MTVHSMEARWTVPVAGNTRHPYIFEELEHYDSD